MLRGLIRINQSIQVGGKGQANIQSVRMRMKLLVSIVNVDHIWSLRRYRYIHYSLSDLVIMEKIKNERKCGEETKLKRVRQRKENYSVKDIE